MGMGIKAVVAPWGWLEFAVTCGNGTTSVSSQKFKTDVSKTECFNKRFKHIADVWSSYLRLLLYP